MSTRCEWCGKKRYSGDDTTWIYNDYDVNGYRKRFFFCCRGHASRFDNEANYKEYDERLKCDYCGDKFYPGDGVGWYLRKAGKHRRYNYCSDGCAEDHINSGNYVWVDSDGLTKDERAYYERKKREAELERIKQQELEKIKKSEENSEFFKKYGVFLVLIISSFAGFGMLKSASADDIVAKMLMIASFFGFYIVFSFFPNVFDGQEIKDLKKKHNFKSNNIPPIFKKINLIISGLFLLILLILTILVKFHGSTEFLFGKSMDDIDELMIEMDSMDLIDSNNVKNNLDSERKIKQPKQSEFNEVTVGNQIWMAENLNINFFQNGDLIPQAKTLEEWEEAGDSKTPAWCYYNFDSSNEKKYGKLYNWYAVGDSRGLAPEGWRIPSDEDWQLLSYNLDYPDGYADKIKAKKGWNLGNGTNSSGFSALPGGYIEDSGFEGIGTDAFWWSSTIDSYTGYAIWINSLNYQDEMLQRFKGNKSEGYSIRCIKND